MHLTNRARVVLPWSALLAAVVIPVLMAGTSPAACLARTDLYCRRFRRDYCARPAAGSAASRRRIHACPLPASRPPPAPLGWRYSGHCRYPPRGRIVDHKSAGCVSMRCSSVPQRPFPRSASSPCGRCLRQPSSLVSASSSASRPGFGAGSIPPSAAIIIAGTVVHAVLIEGTIGDGVERSAVRAGSGCGGEGGVRLEGLCE